MPRSNHAPVVLYTRTNAFRHGPAIEAGIEAIREQAIMWMVPIAVTDDPQFFDLPLLDEAGAVVFLNASGSAMSEGQKARFEEYVRTGGGFAGIHFATGAEPDWPAYETMVGARFAGHPWKMAQRATLTVEDADHPSTAHLPQQWDWTEEWHAFTAPPTSARILMTVDEAGYDPEGYTMPTPAKHPVSWCDDFGEGRTWFTSLGHHRGGYADPLLRAHLWGGINWVRRSTI